jgi:hypothetical protein
MPGGSWVKIKNKRGGEATLWLSSCLWLAWLVDGHGTGSSRGTV